MERKEIMDALTAIYKEVLNDETFVLNETLPYNGAEGWDSLAQMLLIANIEERFNVKFKLREINGIKTVSDIINLIYEKLNG